MAKRAIQIANVRNFQINLVKHNPSPNNQILLYFNIYKGIYQVWILLLQNLLGTAVDIGLFYIEKHTSLWKTTDVCFFNITDRATVFSLRQIPLG